mgnify:CR=1 FL=1
MERDIEALAKYPTESDDWIITVAIGGVAAMLSFLIVPIFVVSGYLVRALRAGMEGAEEPPVFDDWGELITEGFMAAVISLIYQIVPLIVFTVFVLGSLLALLTGSEAGAGLGIVGFIGSFLAWWVLSLLFGYVGFAGVANYAREGSFGAGFDVDVIKTTVLSREYAVAWLWVVALNIVAGVVTSMLNIIPFLGAIVGVFVSFYALVIAGWLWGDGFAAATGGTSEPDTGADPVTA